MEDILLVNCGDVSGDFRITHGIRLALRCSEDEEGLFEVIYYIFMSREVMLFI